jgi:hypothetical protein
MWTMDALARKASRVREEADDRDLELHLNTDLVAVGDDRVVERLAREADLDPEGLDRSAYVLAGSVQAIVDRVERLREATGISYFTIWSPYAEAFAPVISELPRR